MLKSKFFLSLLLFICIPLTAQESVKAESDTNYDELFTKVSYKQSQKNIMRQPIHDTWKPYWVPRKAIQKTNDIFFQTNIGVGLLYFRKVSGYLNLTPSLTFDQPVPYKRGLIYNKSPLVEYLIGYQVLDWLKVSLSYQNQTGIVVQSNVLSFVLNAAPTVPYYTQFKSQLELNSLMAKAYFQSPYSIIWKKVIYSPFIALAFGPGWQSWFPTTVWIRENTVLGGDTMYSPQTVANLTLMLDKGIRIQPAGVASPYSLVLGLKFMYWGQVRNLAKLEKQGPLKQGFFKPFKAKKLYSFAPYLAFQWNFMLSPENYPKLKKLPSKEIDPLFVHQRFFNPSPALVTQFNIGPNFLYFSGIKGNIAAKPAPIFDGSGRFAPFHKRFGYNRAPLYEYMIGYQFKYWFTAALSLQSQVNMVMQSPWIPGSFNTTQTRLPLLNFRSNLNLTSLMAKGYLYLPYSIRAGNFSFNYFTGFGFGPSWQSWTNTKVFAREIVAANNSANPQNLLYLRHKTVANLSFMVDLGFNIKNNSPASFFMITMGCRYNYWGQIRNLGDIQSQGAFNKGLVQPIHIRALYSFAPYIGFQWQFVQSFNGSFGRYPIASRKPFFANISGIEPKRALITSMNIGPNCLRFSKVRASIGGVPNNSRTFGRFGSAPFKGRLRRNVSLLPEYLLGYQVKSWLRVLGSFQMQEGLYISTAPINARPGTSAITGTVQMFTANLALYSLMLKGYLEIPQALVCRSIATTMYTAFGIGPGWQSWSSIEVFRSGTVGNLIQGTEQNVRPKTCQNVVWMIDLGFRFRNAVPNYRGSVTLGLKYIQWGQARNIGKQTQSWNTWRTGLFRPLRIRNVYSWAPYFGFQWSF